MTFHKRPFPKQSADEYDEKVSADDFPGPDKPRKALPGRSKSDKHPVTKRGEPITSPHLIGKWSPR